MKFITTIIVGLILAFQCGSAYSQANGAPGRVTGNNGSHGTFSFSSGGVSVSCNSDCPSSPYSSSTVSPTSQVVSGTLQFSTSHDDSGSIGGGAGSGNGLFQVSCDGGSTWISIDNGSATLPTTTMTFSFMTPTCSGPSNLNTLLFKMVVAGGGTGSFNMNASSPSTTTITW
jgi:hypothetical protein